MLDQREFYALEAGGPLRLEISWGFFSRKLVIRLDGQDIGRIPRAKLTEPREIVLTDHSRLQIQLVPSFKIFGVGFQPYLHLSRDGQVLPGVTPNSQERQQDAKNWIVAIAGLQFLDAIFAPKVIALPESWQLMALVEWQKSFSGAIVTGLLLLGLTVVPKRYMRWTLAAALAIVLGDFLLTLICAFVCPKMPSGYLATAEGLAAVSLYQALRTRDRTQQPS